MSKINYDTHMHLDLYRDREKVINYIESNKSYTIVMTNLPVLYEKYLKMYNSYKYIRFAVGLHPQLIVQYTEQLPKLLKNIKHCKYIGEIGLDFQEADSVSRQIQIDAFRKIVDTCNLYGNKILSIHCRKATKEVLEIIGNNFEGKIILHWFSGNMSELKLAIQNGYYFSINSDMVNTRKGCGLLKEIPLDKILIESDAPFTKSTKEVYTLNFMKYIHKAIADIKQISIQEVEDALGENFKILIS